VTRLCIRAADEATFLGHRPDPPKDERLRKAPVQFGPVLKEHKARQLMDDENELARVQPGDSADRATRLAALKWDTPPTTLVQLANHPEASIRSRVAGNPSTPVATFIPLLVDPDQGVRYSAQIASVTPARLAELEQSDAVAMRRWSADEDERFDRELAHPENWSSAFTEQTLAHPIPPPGTVAENFSCWWGEWHPRRPRWWRSSEGTGDWLERHVYCRSCHRDIGTYRGIAHQKRKVYDAVAAHRIYHRAFDNPLDPLWRVLGSGGTGSV
jgi:hypothetical protein